MTRSIFDDQFFDPGADFFVFLLIADGRILKRGEIAVAEMKFQLQNLPKHRAVATFFLSFRCQLFSSGLKGEGVFVHVRQCSWNRVTGWIELCWRLRPCLRRSAGKYKDVCG